MVSDLRFAWHGKAEEGRRFAHFLGPGFCWSPHPCNVADLGIGLEDAQEGPPGPVSWSDQAPVWVLGRPRQALGQALEEPWAYQLPYPGPAPLWRRTLRRIASDRQLLTLADPESPSQASRWIGIGPASRTIQALMERYSRSLAPVLIQGESGTGKELAARRIHQLSGLRGRFCPVNCAAIPEALLEAEIFGTVRGAYTEARDRPGWWEQAAGGTLFLDEVADLPLSLQAKLLRVLEDGQVRRLGACEEICVQVRVIAACNRSLEAEVQSGRFRQDLFYRLAVLPLALPPLRERPEDIRTLSEYLLRGRKVLSPQALALLGQSPWPGNVRELRNVLERAVVLTDDPVIEPQDLRLTLDDRRIGIKGF